MDAVPSTDESAESVAESRPERARTSLAKRLTRGVRARILISYVLLLAIGAFTSVLAVRQVCLCGSTTAFRTASRRRSKSSALVTGELDRMGRFVDDLLLLAKAESPNFLELETVRLDLLADELLAKATGIADRNWRLGETTPLSIVADFQRLTQAAMNLAQNAVAHTEPSDTITIGITTEGREAVIAVEDTGTGMPASEQRRIFQRFSRGLHSRGRYEGTGIGLAIVRAIAEAHGGTVTVRSKPGQGSRFEIRVPVDQHDPEEEWSMEVGRG